MWPLISASLTLCLFPPGYSGYKNVAPIFHCEHTERKKIAWCPLWNIFLITAWISFISLFDHVWVILPLPFLPTSHINEDKRKTEGQKQIFDVVYEVDGCPVSLFSICSVTLWCFLPDANSSAFNCAGSSVFFTNFQKSLPIYQELKCARCIKCNLNIFIVLLFMVLIVGIKCMWPVKIEIPTSSASSSYLLFSL